MRSLVALLTLLISTGTAVAQKQETKLIDRLLRPNTALANPAQNKKYAAQTAATFDKQAASRSFYWSAKTLTKPFPGERTLTPRQFAARHFRLGDSVANLATRTELTRNDRMISTPAAPGIRSAPESNLSAPVREFADNRPFLGRGKNQKALQAYNRPLTLEEVRELLNKSK